MPHKTIITVKIDFNQIPLAVNPRFKGGEGECATRAYVDQLNRIMKASLTPGSSIGMHTHDTSSEIIFVTSGCGYVIYDGEKIPLMAGDAHYCPKGHAHSLVNDGAEALEFLAVVPQQ